MNYEFSKIGNTKVKLGKTSSPDKGAGKEISSIG
jgi:hypothetical protein